MDNKEKTNEELSKLGLRVDCLVLFRDDLRKECKNKPLNEITYYDFKFESFNHIRVEKMIIFNDKTGTRILKNRWGFAGDVVRFYNN